MHKPMSHKSFRAAPLMGPVLMMVLVAGCSHPATVVGTWTGTTTSSRGVTIQTHWTFTADGKLATTLQATGGPFSGRSVSSDGTYTAGGGTMTQTITSMSEPGRTRAIPHPVTSTYQYALNGDTLTITGASATGPLVLTRQASP